VRAQKANTGRSERYFRFKLLSKMTGVKQKFTENAGGNWGESLEALTASNEGKASRRKELVWWRRAEGAKMTSAGIERINWIEAV